MTHHNYHASGISEDCTHFSIIDRASHTTWISLNVDALVIKRHAFQARYIVLSEVAYNLVVARDWHWQPTAVGFKTTANHAVYSR